MTEEPLLAVYRDGPKYLDLEFAFLFLIIILLSSIVNIGMN